MDGIEPILKCVCCQPSEQSTGKGSGIKRKREKGWLSKAPPCVQLRGHRPLCCQDRPVSVGCTWGSGFHRETQLHIPATARGPHTLKEFILKVSGVWVSNDKNIYPLQHGYRLILNPCISVALLGVGWGVDELQRSDQHSLWVPRGVESD